jgi:hypothetical protein
MAVKLTARLRGCVIEKGRGTLPTCTFIGVLCPGRHELSFNDGGRSQVRKCCVASPTPSVSRLNSS